MNQHDPRANALVISSEGLIVVSQPGWRGQRLEDVCVLDGFASFADLYALLKQNSRVAVCGRFLANGVDFAADARICDELNGAVVVETPSPAQNLTYLSHELRSPIGIIIGLAEMLHAEDGSALQRDFAARILRNGQYAHRLVTNILDAAKPGAAAAGATDIVVLEDFVRELIESMQVHASANRSSVKSEIQNGTPDKIRTDALALRRILVNVLGNAIKFSPGGMVDLKIAATELSGEQSRERMIAFTVTDTGIGLGDSAKLNLFKPFTQADAETSKRFGGSGLGLFISRRLATQMGGSLNLVYSAPGEGSVFQILIPQIQ